MTEEPLKLEIASGIRPHLGYIHLEYSSKKPGVDILSDARMLPFKDGVFDEVLVVHFMEHLFWATVPIAFAEINRVLKIGGILILEVPDFDVAKNRPVERTDMMYETIYMNNRGDGDIGEQDEFVYGFNHSNCYNYDILSRYLIASGFSVERDSQAEKMSVHSWVGVLSVRATKKRKPSPLNVFRSMLGMGIAPNNKWNRMYVEVYGD